MAITDAFVRAFTAHERGNTGELVICGYLFRRSLDHNHIPELYDFALGMRLLSGGAQGAVDDIRRRIVDTSQRDGGLVR